MLLAWLSKLAGKKVTSESEPGLFFDIRRVGVSTLFKGLCESDCANQKGKLFEIESLQTRP